MEIDRDTVMRELVGVIIGVIFLESFENVVFEVDVCLALESRMPMAGCSVFPPVDPNRSVSW